MSEDIRRVRYYQGQYLGADDMAAEQAYHRDMRRRHNIGPHTWGVVVGLGMEIEDETRLWIGPGMAVDGFGREIVVLAPTELGADVFVAEKLLGGMQPVWLAYHEEDTGQNRYGYAECDDGTLRRVVESYRILVGPQEDPDGRDSIVVAGDPVDSGGSVPYQELPSEDERSRWLVLLGQVFWDSANRTFTLVDESARPWVGVVGQSVWAPAGTLRLADRRPDDDLHVTVAGRMAVEGEHTAHGDIRLHGSNLVVANTDGGGVPATIGRDDPGGAGGADLRVDMGSDPDSAKKNRLVVLADGTVLVAVAEDGATDLHGNTTVRDGKELRLEGGRLALTPPGTNPAQWVVAQADAADGSQLQFRETINEAAGGERVVLEVLQGAGHTGDAVLRLSGDPDATLSAAQLKDLTDGGLTTLHQHPFASTITAGRVEIAQTNEDETFGGSGARLVVPANDPRRLSSDEKDQLTDGGVTSLHRHTSAFVGDTRRVGLYANEGTSDVVVVTLPGQRRVLAFASLTGTEEGSGIFGATEYGDAYVEVLSVDGVTQMSWYSGGRHFGSTGSTSALRRPSYQGLATQITFRIRAYTGRAWGVGIVFFEQP